MLIEQEKLRINSRFNWKLTKQSRTEAMNGGDHGAVKSAFVIQPMPSLIGRGGLQNEIELLSKPLAHFIGGTIGKSDGDNLIDVELVFAEDVQVTLDEHRRLSGTRSGRYRDVFLDLVCGCCLLR